jgi:probable HAF family extracellular repeat protein
MFFGTSALPLGLFLTIAYAMPAVSSIIVDLGPGAAYGINSSGQVLVNSSNGNAFLYSGGVDINLGGVRAAALNNLGQVVGSGANGHAFLYSNGEFTDLGTLNNGNWSSSASALNNAGQIIGWSNTTSPLESSQFLYSAGTMTNLSTTIGFSAIAINDSGQFAGSETVTISTVAPPYWQETSATYTQAFIYSNGTLVNLGTLGGNTSAPFALNNAGQAVGYSTVVSGSQHAFLYSNGVMADLGTLGGPTSDAYALNDLGQVVGSSINGFSQQDAFLYSSGAITDLNSLLPANSGWQLQAATGIDDSGQIAGVGLLNGQAHAFLLDTNAAPTPEPACLILTGTGLCLLTAWRKRAHVK